MTMAVELRTAERGQVVALDVDSGAGAAVAARLGRVQVGGGAFSTWVQVRGSSVIESREGRFRLRAGQWIALDKDSLPQIQAERDGLCVGLAVTPAGLRRHAGPVSDTLYMGRGRMNRRDLRITLRLWRAATAAGAPAGALHTLLLHMGTQQRELAARVPRCPGRSSGRRRQVFNRLQRARLYLEGHCDRIVSIKELAELTSFSSWYFSKTFHGLYDESPQAAAVRLRLERAGRLLHETDLAVSEVAGACGFENACSFARAFCGHHGMTATRYRSTHASAPHSAQPAAGGRKASNGA